MGGAIGLGNVTPAAEFNIYVDPHAAAVVFGSGVPLTMLGLDVTHQVLVTPERLERFKALGGPLGEACPWHARLLQPLRHRALPGGRARLCTTRA